MNCTFIVKPVGGDCNLSCSYCYFKQKREKKGNEVSRMDLAILENTINFICSGLDTSEIVWHGGEPLLADIGFFEKVVEFESKWVANGKQVFNSIQTNSTLATANWAKFLLKNNFSVGTSLDGPEHLHNLNRNASFKKTLSGINIFKSLGVLPSVICCVSSKNVDFPKEIFSFFVAQGIKNIKFLQVQGRDDNGKLLPFSVEPGLYADFLISIFDEWINLDNSEIKIRESESIISVMLGGDLRECMFAGKCFEYFTIYPDGNVYGCDSLPKIEAMRFGHIDDGINKIVNSPNFIKFRQRSEELKRMCSKCEWFNVCKGGCLQDWWPDIFENKTRNLFCEALKKIFSSVYERLKEYSLV